MVLSPAPNSYYVSASPLRSRTVGFPQPGSDLGFPLWAFPDSRRSSSTDIHTPRQRWFTHKLVLASSAAFGTESERRTGTAKCPEPLCCMAVLPPCRRHPASPRGTLLPLHRSYGLMRQTRCPPCGFGIASHTGSLQVAVSPCWAQALPVVISANPSLRVWTPTPAAPRVHVPVASPRTLAFPGEATGRRNAKVPDSYFCRGQHNGAAVIH